MSVFIGIVLLFICIATFIAVLMGMELREIAITDVFIIALCLACYLITGGK